MNTLKDIHLNHQGKTSDKWEQYLSSYDIVLSTYRQKPISFLEIGVQNGGSLEIWSQYFAQAHHIVGCDINPKCGELQYADTRIHIVVGSAIDKQTQQKIRTISPRFDVIIDDGSHTSGDIIATFAYYFGQLNDDGVIIFEDLHCSYWHQYDGGLYHPHSSLAFFKGLVDIINYEHWALPIDKNEILRPFYQHYNISPAIDLSHIHSIEFINSMCVIKKKSPIDNELGSRIITGKVAAVESSIYQNHAQKNTAPNQADNPYQLSALAWATQLQTQLNSSQNAINNLTAQIEALNQQLLEKTNQLSASEQNNQTLQSQSEERLLQLHQTTQSFLKYKKLGVITLLKPLIQLEIALHSLNRYRKGFRNLMRYKGSFGKAYQTVRRNFKKHGLQSTKTLLRQSLHGQFLPVQPPIQLSYAGDYKPLVSVIVPNYNHEKYIEERLASIINQSYKNIELIILDDCSKDNSVQIINNFLKDKDVSYQLVVNENNAGNVFKQWKKGIELATGDIIWVCESDDSCDPEFLNNIIPFLADPAVNLAFGRIQFIDQNGNLKEGLDDYRENAEQGIWQNPCIRPAFEWFNRALGVNNVYANVSGGIFRRQSLDDDIWHKACQFKICGDWYLYLYLAGSGKIAYSPYAISYFRQHENNTSASNFRELYYYKEHFSVLSEITKMWRISDNTKSRFVSSVKNQYQAFNMSKNHGDFDVVFSNELNQKLNKKRIHIQLYFLGFHSGGGELFPIVLANQLNDLGHLVSMVALDLDSINEDMKSKLNSRIPVYHISDLARDKNFLNNCGVDIIHTHISGADHHLIHYLDYNKISTPYIVTMHGSHDRSFADYSQKSTEQMIHYVSKWVYIADKNLDFFDGFNLPNVIKFPNAMPLDRRKPSSSRESLGIAKNDLVFAFAARGIPEKGWTQLVQAFLNLQENLSNKNAHLVLMGAGVAQEQAMKISDNNKNIHFLGYECAVNGVLRYSDCLVLPSRFAGESYPLCLIQAIQEGLPCIATDIGEIKSMMTADTGEMSGILIPNISDDKVFIQHLTDALVMMCKDDLRLQYKSAALKISDRYDLKILAERYFDLYLDVINNHSEI